MYLSQIRILDNFSTVYWASSSTSIFKLMTSLSDTDADSFPEYG